MKEIGLISILIFFSSCTATIRSQTKYSEDEERIEKELYFGPKIGKE